MNGTVRGCYKMFVLTWMVGIVDTDILHFELMGTHLMFFSSSDVGKDLAERRSAIYVDKVCNPPKIIFTTLMCTRTFTAPISHGQGTVRALCLLDAAAMNSQLVSGWDALGPSL